MRSPAAFARGRAVLAEASGLVGATAIALTILAGTTRTPWRSFLLFNGDSLVMPMVAKSLGGSQHPIWSLSSQLFVYPEAPIYAVAWWVTESPAPSIGVAAVLVIVVTYLLMRWCARHLLPDSWRTWRPLVAAASLLPFMIMCLLEWRATYNGPEIATLYIDIPYYCGVIIAGLFALCLTLEFMRLAPGRPRRTALILVAGALNAGAATFSDPLFLFQAAAPLVSSLVFLTVLRRISWMRMMLSVVSLGIGSAVGWMLRPVLAEGLVVSAASYAHLDQWRQSVTFLHLSLLDLLSTPRGIAEFSLAGSLLVATIVLSIRRRAALRPAGLAAGIFAVATDLWCLIGTIGTGSQVTRYLIPVTVMTGVMSLVVSALLIGAPLSALKRTARRAVWGASAALLASAIAIAAALPSVITGYRSDQQVEGLACLSRWIDGRQITGAGSFWTTRPLDLYGGSDVDLIQVNFDFSAQAWMMNLASFVDKDVTYFLVSDEAPWGRLASKHLGAPASVTRCPGFQIWDYAGTPGAARLTTDVARSTAAYLKERDR